ncbi:hypothetical protein ACIA37_07835 [Lactobacillus delbrueckii subsp. bulgaricus]|uniref:hypothetical protein n=1 Tax=Lactobacillus delbrueckii TaxID=1584 RepID=UPI0037C9419F
MLDDRAFIFAQINYLAELVEDAEVDFALAFLVDFLAVLAAFLVSLAAFLVDFLVVLAAFLVSLAAFLVERSNQPFHSLYHRYSRQSCNILPCRFCFFYSALSFFLILQ